MYYVVYRMSLEVITLFRCSSLYTPGLVICENRARDVLEYDYGNFCDFRPSY